MKIIIPFIVIFQLPLLCWAADLPSNDQVMKEYNYIYLGIEGEYELDTTIYDFKESLTIFPDRKDESSSNEDVIRMEGFDTSEVKIMKYEGYFNDTLNMQCIVLVRAAELYPAGPIWGIPYSMLLLYTSKNGNWEFNYATSFYDEVTLFQLNGSKISSLYIHINYCNMGICQWLEDIYTFNDNSLHELFYDISSDETMHANYLYEDNKSDFNLRYHSGDTIGCMRQFELLGDVNEYGQRQLKRSEDLTILRKKKNGKPRYDQYIRFYTYKYLNGELVLVETTSFEKLIEPY